MHLRRSLATAALVSSLAAAGGLATLQAAASAAPATTSANVDFRGTWNTSAGGWVITKEYLKTGVCKGTSDFGAPYKLVGCKVTGHDYKFTITEGSYKSYNKGVISGNTLTGSFHDTNGTSETYTATRSSK